MNLIEARGLAAQCWCDPETSWIEMDPRLAEAFAKKLLVVVEQARREEREACAKIAFDLAATDESAEKIAAAIRARGEGK